MTIPDFQTLMLPLLKLLGDGREHRFGHRSAPIPNVIPTKAGTHLSALQVLRAWIPAFAGMISFLMERNGLTARLPARNRRAVPR